MGGGKEGGGGVVGGLRGRWVLRYFSLEKEDISYNKSFQSYVSLVGLAPTPVRKMCKVSYLKYD